MIFDVALILAVILCSLVAGFLFAFAVVVMPGIGKLDDGGFIRAFQVIDGVIQNGQPLFVFVWIGSLLALLAATAIGVFVLTGVDRLLVIAAAAVYALCVQLPTFTVNIPLNERIQRTDVGTMDDSARRRAREDFEGRWNRWNLFRSTCASVVMIVLVVLLFGI
ncbi:MAG: DUF1772 domain-containing protein [Gammaproteobacteria bacterium]|nr:DUF1772 domain-containing protein [Gammaproteobacteria bacterium]